MGNNRWQYLAGYLASVSLFIVGTNMGWTSPVKIKMDDGETPVFCSNSDWGWVAALPSFGSIIGSLFSGTLADYFGRRWTLLATAPIYIIGLVLMYFAKECLVLIIGRLIVGIGYGINFPITSVYIAEISDPKIRGQISASIMLMFNIGILFSLSVGPYVSYHTFLIILILFPIIFLSTFYFMPETPFYRLRQGNREEAIKLLMKYQGFTDEHLVQNQVNLMNDAVISEMLHKTTFIELIKDPQNRRALIIMLGVKTMQFCSGAAAIQSYLQTIFRETESPIPSDMASIACGIIQLIACVFSGLAIDRCGRKALLVLSTTGTALCLFALGLYFYLKDIVQMDVSGIKLVPFVSVMVFVGIQTFGVGSVTYVLLGEMFPTNLKGIATSTVTVYGSICGFVIIKLFAWIADVYNMFAIFWLCMCFMIFGIFFSWFYVLETSGKSLMEIQKELQPNNKLKYTTRL